jgi:sulfur carrier protein
VNVVLNGDDAQVDTGATVADVLARLEVPARRGVAVAVEGEVVPRREWDARVLEEGARVEIVNAIQGG